MDYSEPLMSPFSTRASRNSFARFVSDWISATSSAVEDWAVKLHTSFCWLAPARLTVGVALQAVGARPDFELDEFIARFRFAEGFFDFGVGRAVKNGLVLFVAGNPYKYLRIHNN